MPSRRPGNTRRVILFAVLSLFLTYPLAVRANTPQASESRPEGRIIKRPNGFKRFGRGFLDFLICRKANVRLRRELLEYGPQFPSRYDPSDFSFRALVNTNWPMAVEYELEQQGTVVITIKVMGAPDFTQRLTGDGMGKLRTARFTLPDYTNIRDKGPHPALISFKATRPGPRRDVHAAFRLLGVGAGEAGVEARLKKPDGIEVALLGALPHGGLRPARSAAGRQPARALNVYDVTLGPQQGIYVYVFRVGDKFNRWSADIMKNVQKKDYQEPVPIIEGAIVERPLDPNRPVTGFWNGLDGSKRKVRKVSVWVFVKAWMTAETQGKGGWDAAGSSDSYPIN